MAKDVTNIDIGIVDVYVDGTVIGHTKEGATVTIERDTVDLTVDDYGDTPVDVYERSLRIMIKTVIAEPTLANLKKALPSTTIDGATLEVGSSAGTLYSATAVKLWLHKHDNAIGVVTDDLVVYKAVPIDTVEMSFSNEDMRTFEITWIALIDSTKTDGQLLATFGAST